MKVDAKRALEILVANFNGGIQIGTFGDTAVAAILRAVEEEREWWCELVNPFTGSAVIADDVTSIEKITRAEFERGKRSVK